MINNEDMIKINEFFMLPENRKYQKHEGNIVLIKVFDFLKTPTSIAKMVDASEEGRPALEDLLQLIEEDFAGKDFNLKEDTTLRQLLGSLVKFILSFFGYEPIGSKAISRSVTTSISKAATYSLNKEKQTLSVVSTTRFNHVDFIGSTEDFDRVIESVSNKLVNEILDKEITDLNEWRDVFQKELKIIVDLISDDAAFDITRDHNEGQELGWYVSAEELSNMTFTEAMFIYCEAKAKDFIEVTVVEKIEALMNDKTFKRFLTIDEIFLDFTVCNCGVRINPYLHDVEETIDGDYICEECIDSYRKCQECGLFFLPEGRERKCPECKE